MAILRASGETSRSRPTGRSALVGALLDRLSEELASGDRAPTDAWVASAADGPAEAGIVPLAFGLVATSYATDHPDAHFATRYLALRGKQLDRIFEDALQKCQRGELVPRDELVESLLASLEARDFATCEHSRAVGMWSQRMALKLGLPEAEQRFIGLCGVLHDIGKLATPRAILLKPGPLDDEEWDTMRQHSAAGARILERVPSLRDCARVVRAHHERPDGGGYPDALEGSAIPLAARIIAVADAFHAMISDRPYRAAVPATRALHIIAQGRGVRWDDASVEMIHAIMQPAARRGLTKAVGFED